MVRYFFHRCIVTWYIPTPMCLGSILINSNIGFCKRLAIETVGIQARIVLNYSYNYCKSRPRLHRGREGHVVGEFI